MRHLLLMSVLVLLICGCSIAAEPPAGQPAAEEPTAPKAPELGEHPQSGGGQPVWPEPTAPKAPELGEGWVTLFDGKSLEGWKAAENPNSFVLRNGTIMTNGPRAHLFYVGNVEEHNFKDFEFRADVMTTRGANSGIYLHTRYQETDWPKQGYEIQVDNSHSDPKRTASIYDVENVTEAPAPDNQWFSLEVTVRGKRIVTKVNGKTLIDYTEPENPRRPSGWEGRRLSSGTFALQCHDPGSRVYFANIMVKPLKEPQPEKPQPAAEVAPPKAPELGERWVSLFDGKSLDGWKGAENPGSFRVENGMIVANGPKAMLYYMGDVVSHDFKNFEFRVDVRTTPGSNSGVFIHTPFQETGWPTHGYEIQINNSAESVNRTAGIYDVANVTKSVVGDDVWYTLYVSVNGKRIVTKVDDKTVAEFTEPEDYTRPEDSPNRRLGSGTFGLQVFDEKSKVYFANVMVKPLPE